MNGSEKEKEGNTLSGLLRSLIFWGPKRAEEYGGLLVMADPGLHGQIATKVRDLVPTGGKVLDLGAGEGALSLRLKDLGYEVTAVDVDADTFRAEDVTFEQVDFDDSHAFERLVERYDSTFDAVLGVEVIEHVQDQWRYARQLIRLARPGGFVVVTTPNTSSWLSRFLFFFKGQFSSFDDHGLTYGHISPISAWELELVLTRCGLTGVSIESAGTLPPLYFVPTREALISLVVLPLRPFMHGLIDGWCLMATGRRPS
jgi:SAM-dependent methyltransferase